jgi:hypothetical protein
MDRLASTQDERSYLKILLSKFLGFEYAQQEHASVVMERWQFGIRIFPWLVWCIVVVFAILVWIMRYLGVVETDAQRIFAQNMMLQAEVKIAASLAPAFELMSSLAMGARAGLFNGSSYAPLMHAIAPHMLANPSVKYVRVAGVTKFPALIGPGKIHNTSFPIKERMPFVALGSSVCKSQDEPESCLGLNNTAFINASKDGTSVRYQRPGFLTFDSHGQPVSDVDTWIYCHRVAAKIDATNYSSKMRLAAEVILDLSGARSAAKSIAPKNGAIYLVAADGTVLAGSNWEPKPKSQYDPVVGDSVYPLLWDLNLPWASALTSEVIAKRNQTEAAKGTDMVIVRPLAVGDSKSGSYQAGFADLRIVSTVPLSAGTSTDMKNLINAAMVTLGTPGVLVLVTLFGSCASIVVVSCANWLFDHID